ncbi:hypothetical protein JAAARDRAFT_195725 [Jaapia argillacea MUCL 33604]|uniref:Uncharacterized protein n=1 Tax=Jaapia argillacea MUCL 33604 TaxID=933084 RepID=A0A067PK88_9AGAM|nr:hypothetical protein JAAARDRAFT_195725 [Jaapia argillacea MUCL 33604]
MPFNFAELQAVMRSGAPPDTPQLNGDQMPQPPLSKCQRTNDNDDSDSEGERNGSGPTHHLSDGAEDGAAPSPRLTVFSTGNLSAFTAKECKRAKLDASEEADVQAFSKMPIKQKLVKLFIREQVNAKVLTKMEWEKNRWDSPSEELKENLKKYVYAVVLCPTLHSYRNKFPLNHLLAIVKKLRWDLPPKIEQNAAHWSILSTEAGNAITQKRRAVKQQIKISKDVNLYVLAESTLGDSGCTLSLEFIAHVAVLWCVYFEEGHHDHTYWPKVDEFLGNLRDEANGCPDPKIAALIALKFIIDKDLKTYGSGEVEEPDFDTPVPEWAETVNAMVNGGSDQRDE